MKSVMKQDLNFLTYPLWFQVSRATQKAEWSHPQGYTLRADYRAPDQVDALFLMYILMRAQQESYQPRQQLSRYEILKGCGCPVNPQYLERLADSLKRWCSVTLDFQAAFFQDGEHLTRQFKILHSAVLKEKERRLDIRLDPEFLSVLQNSRHFKYVDFNFYRLLRRPVSRRLFELLTAMFKEGNQWRVPLVELGHDLTLYYRKRRRKDGTVEEVLYPSDVLTAVKAALEEINTLSTDIETLRELGTDPREIYAVTYEVEGKRKYKSITFHKASLSHLFDALTEEKEAPRKVKDFAEPYLEELISFLKRSSRPLRDLVSKYYRSEGYEYVKWNIFYANRNGARNYVSYLKLCLQHNWAQEFREEYERMFNTADHEPLDSRKLSALINVAKQADYLRMQDGKRFRIKRIFPNGAIEISNRTYKMDFILSPSQAYQCRFEREDPMVESKPKKRTL